MEGRGSGRVEKGDEGYELRLRLKCCTDKEPDLHPALSGDEVYTPSPRRSEGWRGQLFARCSNRTTSKTSILTLNEQRNLSFATLIDSSKRSLVQKTFLFSKKFFRAQRTLSMSHWNFYPSRASAIFSPRKSFFLNDFFYSPATGQWPAESRKAARAGWAGSQEYRHPQERLCPPHPDWHKS